MAQPQAFSPTLSHCCIPCATQITTQEGEGSQPLAQGFAKDSAKQRFLRLGSVASCHPTTVQNTGCTRLEGCCNSALAPWCQHSCANTATLPKPIIPPSPRRNWPACTMQKSACMGRSRLRAIAASQGGALAGLPNFCNPCCL